MVGTKDEYLGAIRARYRQAGREYKAKILDEFCEVNQCHRKHAIRLLNQASKRPKRKPGRPSEYGAAEQKVLEAIWVCANRPCSIRFRPLIHQWLPFYEKEHGLLSPAIRTRLTTLSARTLDRLMKPTRKRLGSRGLGGTRPGNILKHQIPIVTHHGKVLAPGLMEADTVAHCGGSMSGNFVWSLTLTDIFSGWTENKAVWNRGYEGVSNALKDMEESLPFFLTGFHSDNGGEFLNEHLFTYLKERPSPVAFTRSRPNHKDDNAYVEQKNYTHVRLLLGYERIEDDTLIPAINYLYRLWSLYNNLFQTSMKLEKKVKVGSRYIRSYAEPTTPAQRLLNHPDLDQAHKTTLTEQLTNTNPFSLKSQIDHHQRKIFNALR